MSHKSSLQYVHLSLYLIITQEAPPLIPAFSSDRYHIKWTQLADLPVPFYDPYVAVQHHKIYVTGDSPNRDAECQIYVLDLNTNRWGQLPPSGHYYGIPHIIGGRLAIIGGRLSATKKMTNKVSTFDEGSQTWTSYYPDLLSVRSRPGVVSHLEHVIVAGGTRSGFGDERPVDDIEVLNWIENSHWRKASIKLPVPMYGFTPTVSNDDMVIVGYTSIDTIRHKKAYKILVSDIAALTFADHDQQCSSPTCTPTKWTGLTATTHWYTALLPNSSPPMVVGGDKEGTPTADIKVYDYSGKSWKKIVSKSLSSARSGVALGAVYNNAIIVLGGCTEGGSKPNVLSSIVTTVELGQLEL